jgi:hypothetical protein
MATISPTSVEIKNRTTNSGEKKAESSIGRKGDDMIAPKISTSGKVKQNAMVPTAILENTCKMRL